MKLINTIIFFSISFSLSLAYTYGQNASYSVEDIHIFDKYIQHIQLEQHSSKQELLQATATFFIGTPYVAGTLDINDKESLIINLREFDCVTFIETVIALANTVESGNYSFDNFSSQLQKIRYRNGVVDGYESRLHYTTDWIYANIQNKLLSPSEVQSEYELDDKKIDFMSTHQSSYNALKDDDVMLNKIRLVEDNINSRGGFRYLPKDRIVALADKIGHMSMVAFTTSIKGLDTTHTGFTYKNGDKLGLIHASSLQKKVVIDNKSLSEYCMSQKSSTGVIVANVE
ncbi:MAG: DUF1460 domain-containing protein [Proteiniphilum sp.]|nr:DUF1460 domain-containing protein [Proteiniphilum sp.]